MSTVHVLTLLSVLLAAVVIAVLALALALVRQKLESVSETLHTLAGALEGVESVHLRGLETSVQAINAQFSAILALIPGIGAKAAMVAERRSQ
jgi:uncharacterized protein YoxC